MRVVTRLRIGKDRIFLGKGVREMLDAIDQTKSIRKATEITNISYSKAMRMLRTMEEELGFAIVISEKGGATRGSTILTEKGKEVLEAYKRIENKVEIYAKKLVEEEFDF